MRCIEKMKKENSRREYKKTVSLMKEECNIISIADSDFPSIDDVIDVLTFNLTDEDNLIEFSDSMSNFVVQKIVVSIISNKVVTIAETHYILAQITTFFNESEIILGIGQNGKYNKTIARVILS
jgi:hypothetical protein